MNSALLRYEMQRKGLSMRQLCEILNISKSAFWRKCTGKSEFKQSEISKMIQVLDLKEPERIFFADGVS